MEDAPLFNEKQSIREKAKSLKKYGSTCNHFKRPELLLKYFITKTDTLQGIALKYGVTTEQIRRANRLFASDSLFLREYLLIPITKESPHYDPNDENIIENRLTHRASISTMQTVPDSSAVSPATPEDQTCLDNFLDRVDTAIAMTKKYVKQRQDSIDVIDSPSNGGSNILRNSHSNYGFHNQSTSASGSTHDLGGNIPHTQIVMTQGKKVRTSLQRLQQQQDEMFEL